MLTLYGDYHTHSTYSDSPESMEKNIIWAQKNGLKELAITDHGYNNYTMSLTREKVIKQRAEIIELRAKYPDLSILHGIEADIIGVDGTLDLRKEEFGEFDLVLCGFHSYTKPKSLKDFRKLYLPAYLNHVISAYQPNKAIIAANTTAFVTAIKNNPIDIITHVNNYCKVDVLEVAKVCADYGTLIELNSKHIDIGLESFGKIVETGVGIMANTDSHYSGRVGSFGKIEAFLTKTGFSPEILANYNKRPKFRSKF